MSKQAFILRGSAQVDLALTAMMEALNDDVMYEAIIKPHRKNRSLAQNSLMWRWHTEYVNYFGVDGGKNAQHEQFKMDYVLPIMLRDDDDSGLVELHGLCESNIDALAALVKVLSTTHLNTAQFSEALDEYDRQTSMKGLAFAHPEDIYYQAIGRVA